MSTNCSAENYKIGTSQICTPECDYSLAVLISHQRKVCRI